MQSEIKQDQVKWSGTEKQVEAKEARGRSSTRAKKRETEPTTRSKNLEHNGSPKSGQAKSRHPSSPQGQTVA